MTKQQIPIMRRIQGIMFKMPLMITCNEFEEFINAYLEGSLPTSKRLVFEMHLKMCRECRDFLSRYQDAMILTKGAVLNDSNLEEETVPEDLINAILDARQK